jgi:putative nucleotidyltransferase with HDIG domain
MSLISNKVNGKIPSAVIKLFLLLIAGIISFLTLVLPESLNDSSYPMKIGDVAAQDILAPYSLTYESKLLTEKARQEAAASIEPIYLPIDPSIGRRQVENLRTILYYITIVRQDNYASLEEKSQDIQAIENNQLSDDTILSILQLNTPRWEALEFEATAVLEEMMRNTLRTSDIPQAQRDIPSRIDFSFPEDQANIVAELVESFIVPNSIHSEEQTELAKNDAILNVDPVLQSFMAGETLVSRGQIITNIDLEALQQFGLIQPENRVQEIIGAAVLVSLLCVVAGMYFIFQRKRENFTVKSLLLITISFLIILGIARFFVIGRTILPYVYPIAAFGLTLTVIFNFELAFVLSVILSILTSFGGSNYPDLMIFYIIPTVVGMLSLGKARRISTFFVAGIAIGLAGAAVILAYRLPDAVTDWKGLAELTGASFANGISAASITLLLQHFFAQILGITTSLQLLDIARPDHPLLQQMLRNSPGSYQHSLQVANLAEQAAESIGADSLLVRVGAIFHDCGKSQNPQFFIENQVHDKIDSHDDIDPYISAQTIINHVNDGVELAKKHRLPTRIIDFIKEHHGTMYTHYQYTQAVNSTVNDEKVEKSKFTYPGPKPQSRETALLMLADGTEARARAEVPKNEEDLRSLINTVFDFYGRNHQLEDTNLTLRDLEEVKRSFFRTLMGTYHPRVKYPSIEEQKTKPLAENAKAEISD